MDFLDKVVVITGASSGIGAAAAVMYAKQSAKLVLVGRNEEALNKVSKQCQAVKGIYPLIVKAEITIDDEVKNIVKKTIETFGRIDVLVNSAGVGYRGSITDGIELFDKAISTNVRWVYLLTGLAMPYLIESKGNIVNVSSVAAFRSVPGVDFLPYCISKAAMDQLTRCLARDIGPLGVRINSVNPGCTNTPFAQTSGMTKEEAADVYKARANSYPLRKITESEDVADMILYISSSRAHSITGTTIVIDNGESLL